MTHESDYDDSAYEDDWRHQNPPEEDRYIEGGSCPMCGEDAVEKTDSIVDEYVCQSCGQYFDSEGEPENAVRQID